MKPPLYPAEKLAAPSTWLVTGATGFLGAHIVERLLNAGHTVHALSRAPEDVQHVRHLLVLPGAKDRLSLFKVRGSRGGILHIVNADTPSMSYML